jgi:hypothetical protein
VLIRTDGGVALIDAVNPALRRPYSHGSPAGPGQLCRACIFPARLAAPFKPRAHFIRAQRSRATHSARVAAIINGCSAAIYKRLQRGDDKAWQLSCCF